MPDAEGSDSGPVFRLIYSSHSLIAPDDLASQLGAIFTTARQNNRRLDVTGALVIADDKTFVQALEGEETVVRDLFASISRDTRHEHIRLVETQTVAGRTFGRWAMAKVAHDGTPDIRLMSNARKQTIVAAPGGGGHITPEQEKVLAFMREATAGDTVKK